MKLINLTQNKQAIVDDKDFDWLSRWKWKYHSKGYACRQQKSKGKVTQIYMHRLINNTPNGLETDHINHDKLDNRRLNLRSATASQNRRNVELWKTNTSGVRGVTWNKYTNKWHSQIKVGNKNFNLGEFEDIEDARRIRLVTERIYF